MAESLFLNQNQVDLYAGNVTRKIQIADIGDINARKSSYSYTIKLPKTSKNIQVFEMLGIAGNTSRKPFEEISADYVVDSVYLVTNGYAIIKETDDNFNVNIIDGVRSLGDLLGAKKLSSLPLSDLNHILTTQNYIDSYSNTEGFIYGIANYGQGVSSSNLKVEKQAPSIFTHTLFRRIFEANGLSLQGEFFTTNEKYLNEVVTPSRGYTVSDIAFTSTAKGGVGSNQLSRYDYASEYLTFNDKFTLTNNSLVGASVILGNIVFSVAGTYKLTFAVDYSIYNSTASVQVKVNGTNISSIYLYDDKTHQTRNIVFTVDVGDEVSVHVSGSSIYSSQFYDGYQDYNDQYFEINYSASVSASLYLQTGGQLIKYTDYIGDMTQIDFLKDVINRYGLLLHPIQ